MDLSLVSAGDDIKIWDITNYVQLKQFNPHDQNINSVSWSNDYNFLASASVHSENVAVTYLKSNESVSLPGSSGCLTVDICDTSRYMLMGGSDGLISVWDLKSMKKKKVYKGHKGPVTTATFNKNSTHIASGSETGEIILHNVVSGLGRQPLVAPNIQAIKQVQYSLNKKSLLGSVSDDGSVNIWDCNKDKLVQTFNCHQAPATGLSFSPINDILLMSVGLDKRIACLDLQTKMVVKVMNAESPLTSISTKSDGVTVVVGSTRGKIYQYDLRMTSVPVKTVEAHRSSVQSLRFQTEPVDTSSNRTGSLTNKQHLKHRQLPVSPKSNTVNRDVSGTSSMDRKPLNQGVAEDIFSPLREGYQDHSSVEMDYQGSFTKPAHLHTVNGSADGFGDALFSPINENIGLDSSGVGLSPLAYPGYQLENRNSSGLMENQASSGLMDYNRMDTKTSSLPETTERRPEPLSTKHNNSNSNGQHKQVTFTTDETDPYAFLVNGSSSSGSDVTSPELKRPRSKASNQHQIGISASPSFPGSPQGDSSGGMSASSNRAMGQQYTTATTPDGVNAQSSIVKSFEESRENRSVKNNPPLPSDMGQFAQLIRTVVREEVRTVIKEELRSFKSDMTFDIEEMMDNLHKDILNLHVEIIKQFQQQQYEIAALLEHYSVNKDFVAEIERLQDEVKRLKKNF